MNRLWTKIKAFTLAELVIVMLIIAVVAGVSIKITKAKLDSVVSYTYYSAYNTLRLVAGEMMADSDASEEYGELSYNYKEKSLVDKFIDNYLIPKSYAELHTDTFKCPICTTIGSCDNRGCVCIPIAGCMDDNKGEELLLCPDGTPMPANGICKTQTCNLLDSLNCTNKGGIFNLTNCTCNMKDEYGCDIAEKNACLAAGDAWFNTFCKCSPSAPTPICDQTEANKCIADGGTWDPYPSCSCTPKVQECTLTQNDCSKKQVLDKENCQCRDKKVTLPKTGKEFCEAFVSYTNTTTYNCNGNNTAEVSAAANSGDFKNLAPDIVLRNGMKVYNAKNDYVKITALVGNSPIVYNLETNPLFIDSVFTAHSLIREKFAYLFHNLLEQPALAICASMSSTDGSCPGQICDSGLHKEGTGCFACCTPKPNSQTPDQGGADTQSPSPDVDGSQPEPPDEEGLPANLNEHGYIVYIDIDGSKGDSVLYEDVFPFYMTLEGRVVPAYKSGEEAGGNSTSHLTVSVQYDVYTSGDRRENWMSPKGTDFQHAACMSGYVTANTYCSGVNDAQLASKRAICSQTSSDCRLKVNKPLRF